MKSIPIKQVTRPEGYNGATVKVWLVFDCENGLTIEAHSHGFHNSHVPRELGALQSEWMINNYPSCRNFYKDVVQS